MKRRNAWGQSVKKGVSLAEFELGARVVSDFMSENVGSIADKVLASRIDRAVKVAESRCEARLRPFVDSFVRLYDDENTVWKVDAITHCYGANAKENGPRDLKITRVLPEPSPPYTQDYKLSTYVFPKNIREAWHPKSFMIWVEGVWFHDVPPWEWGTIGKEG